MQKENLFMIDIESTGAKYKEDKLMEVAIVEIEYNYPYWYPTGRTYHRVLHLSDEPTSVFNKKHQVALFKRCNEAPVESNVGLLASEIKLFIHNRIPFGTLPQKPDACSLSGEIPKLFIGWNASNFDIPFLIEQNVLTPSYYVEDGNGREELRGDVHYRIYEQTGSLQVICDLTGLNRKTIEALAIDLNPTNIILPAGGKAHDALYDCYKQIMMQNGLIAIGRNGIKK